MTLPPFPSFIFSALSAFFYFAAHSLFYIFCFVRFFYFAALSCFIFPLCPHFFYFAALSRFIFSSLSAFLLLRRPFPLLYFLLCPHFCYFAVLSLFIFSALFAVDFFVDIGDFTAMNFFLITMLIMWLKVMKLQ